MFSNSIDSFGRQKEKQNKNKQTKKNHGINKYKMRITVPTMSHYARNV